MGFTLFVSASSFSALSLDSKKNSIEITSKKKSNVSGFTHITLGGILAALTTLFIKKQDSVIIAATSPIWLMAYLASYNLINQGLDKIE
jgi:hypothetical protein